MNELFLGLWVKWAPLSWRSDNAISSLSRREVYQKLSSLYQTHTYMQYLDAFQLLEKFFGYSEDHIPQLQDISGFLKSKLPSPSPLACSQTYEGKLTVSWNFTDVKIRRKLRGHLSTSFILQSRCWHPEWERHLPQITQWWVAGWFYQSVQKTKENYSSKKRFNVGK